MIGQADMGNNVIIRPAVAKDKGRFEEFFDSMGAESRAFFDRSGYNRSLALQYCDAPDPEHRFWVAEYEGKVAGYVYFAAYDTMIPSLGIAVRDDLQGLHLGSRLMDHAIEQARLAGKGGIRLTTLIANVRGQVLYAKKGFKCMGQYTNAVELFYLKWFEDPNITSSRNRMDEGGIV